MLAVLAFLLATPSPGHLPERPRLVVVFSIDQFRGDYAYRFADQYLPARTSKGVGGFNYIAQQGANYVDAHYEHVPTYTGVGHGAIMTGSIPAINGIIGNNWFDRETKKGVYCVDDPSVKTVGSNSAPMGPRNLKVSTVGDELKMATGGKAKVVGVAFKDRGSILMAGHAADTVVWFDGGSGKWVSNNLYEPSGALKPWVSAVNDEGIPAKSVGNNWIPLTGVDFSLTKLAPFVGGTPSPLFSHKISDNEDFLTSSFGQEFVFHTLEKAVVAEQLGKDDVPDVLVVNLATNDYVGHAWGPNSPEVLDISVRTDRLLSAFFNFLDKSVNGGLARTTIVITGDHGVVPIPEEAKGTYRIPSSIRGSNTAVTNAVEAALKAKYGEGKYVLSNTAPHLYLDRELLSTKKAVIAESQRVAAEAARGVDGILDAFAAEDIAAGRLPDWPWMRQVANGLHRKLGGDVMVFSQPGALFSGGTGTSHGTPWVYDTHVPVMIAGPGVKAGTYTERVSICDIAPTLSFLLRIEQPNGSVGRILSKAVGD